MQRIQWSYELDPDELTRNKGGKKMLFAPEHQEKRLQMIEKAFKSKAPRTYTLMQASGNLQWFLESHEESMMKSFSKAYCEASLRILWQNVDPEKTVQSLRMASHELWRNTLASWLEFDYPTAETTSTSRTSNKKCFCQEHP
jgi:hypothetical protein